MTDLQKRAEEYVWGHHGEYHDEDDGQDDCRTIISDLVKQTREQALWEVWQLYCSCGNPDHRPPMEALLRESSRVRQEMEKPDE